MNRDEMFLDPPSFDLPPQYYANPAEYELWSLRTPVHFDIQQLNGKTLQIQNLDNLDDGDDDDAGEETTTGKSNNSQSRRVTEKILTSFQIENDDDDEFNRTFTLSLSQPNETHSFRVLKKKNPKIANGNEFNDSDNDNDDDDDDDGHDNDNGSNNENQKEMIPIPIKFAQNLKIAETTRANITDLDLAPSMDRAPRVDFKKEKMRIPYTKIKQRDGLIRRWNVFGSNAIVIVDDKIESSRSGNSSSGNSSSETEGTGPGIGDDVVMTKCLDNGSNDNAKNVKRKVSDDVVDVDNGRLKKKKKTKKH